MLSKVTEQKHKKIMGYRLTTFLAHFPNLEGATRARAAIRSLAADFIMDL